MVPRETRLAPSSLRRALRALGPLALLCSVALVGLLGLLAQSASASHTTPVPPPAFSVVPASPTADTTPEFVFTRPAGTTAPDGTTVDPVTGATSTVTIDHAYDDQCVFDTAPASFSATTPTCGTPVAGNDHSYTGMASADGTWVLSVRTVETTIETTSVEQVDGTVSTSSSTTVAYSDVATASVVVDATAPQVTVTVRTPSPHATTQPVWDYTITGGGTAVCVLTGPDGQPVPDGTCGPASYTAPTLSVGGSYTLTVSSSDAAGNTGSGAASYVLDLTAPVIGISGPTRGTASSVTWTVTVTGATTVTCSVSDGTPATCSTSGGTVTATLTADGSVTLTVMADDGRGNSASATATYARDTAAPSGPVVASVHTGSTGNASPLSWTWAALAGHTTQCRPTEAGVVGAWAACTTATSHSTTPGAQGSYSLEVRYVDDLGNVGTPGASSSYLYDSVAPVDPTVAREGAAGPVQPGAIVWNVDPVADVTLIECRLTGPGASGVWETCGSRIERTLSEGSYTLEVRQSDAAGNVSGVTTTSTVVDGTPPGAPGVSGPSGPTTSTTVAWTLTQDPTSPGTAFECRLIVDGVVPAGFSACQASYTGLADGRYRLEVRAVDDAGNRSPSTLSDEVVVDTTGPAAPQVTLPVAAGRQPSATWSVTPAPDAAGSECRLGYAPAGGPTTFSGWATCTSYAFDLLSGDGTYVLEVRTRDALGNLGAATTGPGYLLDTTPAAQPTVTGSRTGRASATDISYAFVAEPGGTATCRLYRNGVLVRTFTDCQAPSPFAVTLIDGDGSYTMGVVLTDPYGNDSTEGFSDPYVLDTTPPATPEVVGSRTGTDNEPAITYAFSGEGTATCRLYRDGVLVQTTPDCHLAAQPMSVVLPNESGSYVLTVTYTDAYGNVGLPGSSAPYLLDVTAPGGATVTVSPSTDNVPSATWTVTPPEAGTTTECRLHHDGAALGGWAACSGPYTFALTDGDGAYALEVRVIDAVGNVGAGTLGATYTLDTTPPPAPVVGSDRTGPDNERTVTYTFSGEGAATCTLLRDGVAVAGPQTCSSAWTVLLPDVSGRYVLLVTYTDAVGNEGAAGSSPAYDLDVTPPATPQVVSDRSGTDNERTVTYTFSGEGQASCQLLRDGAPLGEAVPCTSPWVVELPAVDGSYALLVRFTDAVGNTSAAGSSVGYLLDLTAPPAPAVGGVPATGNLRTVTWTYSGEGSASCTLLLNGLVVLGPVACDPTSYTATLSSDGLWSLQVTFTDAVGNRGPPGTSAGYLLDTMAPDAPRVTGPAGPAQLRTPDWTVAAAPDLSVECRLTRAGAVIVDWAACAGSFSADLTGLPDAAYVLEARARDAAGNVSAIGASQPYVLDTTAPLAPAVSGPAGPSQNSAPGFTWTAEAGAVAQCQLSREGVAAGAWFACTAGQAMPLDRDGVWTLAVRLTDAAGNVSVAASSGGYVLDTTAPAAPGVTPPKTPGRDLAPSWTVGVEAGAALECRLLGPDGGVLSDWTACTTPRVTSLAGRPDGRYTLEVRATDVAGNLSGIGKGVYVLDTVAPAAAVVTGPTSGRSRSISFTLAAEPAATTRCRLTSGTTVLSDFAPCSTGVAYDLTGSLDGTYTLTVRVTDEAGNPGPAATATYVLDTTAPAAPVFTLLPATPSPARSVTWTFTSEAGSTLVCRLTFPTGAVRELAGCASPLTVDLTGLPDGTYTLSVRAVDAAGNVGAVATEAHVLEAAAAAAPEVTGPATPGSTRTPAWRISGTGAVECRLTRGTAVLRDWTPCTAGSFTADLFNQPDGLYTLSVRSRDAAGVLSATATSRYVLDTAAPGPATLVAPPTPSTGRTPTWTIASAEIGAKAECRVLVFDSVLHDWKACAVSVQGSPFGLDLSAAGDGAYTLVVRLIDAAGNRSSVEATSVYVLDNAAPAAVGVRVVQVTGFDRSPRWTLSTSPGVVLECRLTSPDVVVADWAPCADEYVADLTGLPDGPYTLTARAVSAAGMPGPESADVYLLNTSAPTMPGALVAPKSPSNDRTPIWQFTLPPGTTGVCSVQSGGRTVYEGACTSTSSFQLDLSTWSDGTYTLSIRAVDAAGNLSEALISKYVLETVPKDPPVFTATPGDTGSNLDPQWRFTFTGASAECRLLSNGVVLDDWIACTSPHTVQLAGRPDGVYVLQVRTVSAGNTSAPISSSYRLDRTGVAVVTFGDTPTTPGRTTTSVQWTFSAPDGTTLQCRLQSPSGTTGWAACLPGDSTLSAAGTGGRYVLDLAGRPDGTYLLEVRVVEADGRLGAASSSSYELDTRPPAPLSFAGTLPVAGRDPNHVWHWVAPKDGAVECRLLDGAAVLVNWEACDGSFTRDLASLGGEGDYVLQIRQTDLAGNVSATTASSYRYDVTAPTAPSFTTRPPARGNDRTVSWVFAVPADAVVVTCTVRGAGKVLSSGACASGRFDMDLGGQPDGTYSLTVTFADLAGNQSSSSQSYGLSTLGPVPGGARVDPPVRGEPPAPFVPAPRPDRPQIPGPGPRGTGPIPPVRSGPRPDVPTVLTGEDDEVRLSRRAAVLALPTDSSNNEQPASTATSSPGPVAARPLPEDVPEAIRGVVTETFKRPTLPLALLGIVLLFLLAQNRIDRRDPKLASAPVDAEPELDFTVFVRRPGGAAT